MKPKNRFSISKRWMPYVMILPVIVIIAAFLFLPVLNVFYYSLQRFNMTKPHLNGFVGLENFVKIFTNDPLVYNALWISAKWVFLTVSLRLVGGMVLALALNSISRGRGLLRTILFSPWAVSGVIVSMLWTLLTNENMGLINNSLVDLGILSKGIAWLGNIKTVFGVVVSAEVWRGLPFFIIILLAALQSIPTEIVESARVDGANALHIFRKITLPYLKPTIIYVVMLQIIWEYNNVDIIYVLTRGGPANHTLTMSMYTLNQAIKLGEFGYGAALNVISFLILLVFILLFLKLTKFGKEVD